MSFQVGDGARAMPGRQVPGMTPGKIYAVINVDPAHGSIKLEDDAGYGCWYPDSDWENLGRPSPILMVAAPKVTTIGFQVGDRIVLRSITSAGLPSSKNLTLGRVYDVIAVNNAYGAGICEVLVHNDNGMPELFDERLFEYAANATPTPFTPLQYAPGGHLVFPLNTSSPPTPQPNPTPKGQTRFAPKDFVTPKPWPTIRLPGFTFGHVYVIIGVQTSFQYGKLIEERIELLNDSGLTVLVLADHFDPAPTISTVNSLIKTLQGGRSPATNPCLEMGEAKDTHYDRATPTEPKTCSCPMRELMMYGCRCGGFEAERQAKSNEKRTT